MEVLTFEMGKKAIGPLLVKTWIAVSFKKKFSWSIIVV